MPSDQRRWFRLDSVNRLTWNTDDETVLYRGIILVMNADGWSPGTKRSVLALIDLTLEIIKGDGLALYNGGTEDCPMIYRDIIALPTPALINIGLSLAYAQFLVGVLNKIAGEQLIGETDSVDPIEDMLVLEIKNLEALKVLHEFLKEHAAKTSDMRERACIIVDKKRGIHPALQNDKNLRVRLSPHTKIFKAFRILLEGNRPMHSKEIARKMRWDGKMLRRGIRHFNQNAKDNMQIENDLIKEYPGGYEPNHEDFLFELR